MILVIGGESQGKKDFVLNEYDPQKCVDGETCSFEEALDAAAVDHFHLLIRRMMLENYNINRYLSELINADTDRIVICNEIGCGIVPVDRFERAYRDEVGRCCRQIAGHSDQVVRVFCGIPQYIKR